MMVGAVILGITWSCQKDEAIKPQEEQLNYLTASDMEGMTRLGKKLENPYAIENMRKALENLKASNPDGRINGEDVEITTTHLYIRFKPKTEDELSILQKDSTLILYSYPLDYEIDQPGDFYHDPEVPVDQPTYQYCAVEADKKLPDGVKYELLAELFIPDEDSDEADESNGRFASAEWVEALVDEALRITGNQEEEVVDKRYEKRSKWRPSGRVRVWDDAAGRFVPVVGAEVRARRWFTTHIGWTNNNGLYSAVGKFKRPANYSIRWEKYHFSIRTGTFGQATYNGPKQRGNWNKDFGSEGSAGVSDRHQYYALIFQAARDYYYGSRFGLSSPPRNSDLKPQVKIAADIKARQNDKPSHSAMYARTGGLLPSIYIRTWTDRADRVYAVTTHELAHAAHWNMDRDAFKLLVVGAYGAKVASSEAVIESWANGVEWQFAQARYRNLLGIAGYEYEDDKRINRHVFPPDGRSNGNYQEQRLAGFNERANDLIYSSIVVDMIDNENQRFTRGHGGSVAYPVDNVAGYTIQQIEQGLRGVSSWSAWRESMKQRHNNPTEENINELFNNWY